MFTDNPITSALQNVDTIVRDRCRKYRGFYPSFTPIINSLSTYTSKKRAYSKVFITGENFLPNGTTTVNFGSYKNIPVTYYSSFNISFVVPPDAWNGDYEVVVSNLYNDNFSPPVKYTYAGNPNNSAPVLYTITP